MLCIFRPPLYSSYMEGVFIWSRLFSLIYSRFSKFCYDILLIHLYSQQTIINAHSFITPESLRVICGMYCIQFIQQFGGISLIQEQSSPLYRLLVFDPWRVERFWVIAWARISFRSLRAWIQKCWSHFGLYFVMNVWKSVWHHITEAFMCKALIMQWSL